MPYPNKQKRKYNSRLRSLLTIKQDGDNLTLLELILKEARKGMAPTRMVLVPEVDENGFKTGNQVEKEQEMPLEERKFATKTIMDFLPYIMTRESVPLVQITNNTQNNKIVNQVPIQSLIDFMQQREHKIEALEERERTRQLKTLEGSKAVQNKLPANSPLNKEN